MALLAQATCDWLTPCVIGSRHVLHWLRPRVIGSMCDWFTPRAALAQATCDWLGRALIGLGRAREGAGRGL